MPIDDTTVNTLSSYDFQCRAAYIPSGIAINQVTNMVNRLK